MRSSWQIGTETLRSIFDYETPLPAGTTVPIDFSIKDSSFAYVSYIDVIGGVIDPAALRGKTVYVGPTAIELRDILPVPVYRALPGVVVQAFATESVRAGLLRSPPEWLFVMALGAWTVCCAALFNRRSWRQNVLFGATGYLALGGASIYLYAAERVVLEIVPFAIILFGIFIATTVRSLDQQTWKALAYAVGLKRRDALLKSVVDSTTDCILCVDQHGNIRTANPATALLFDCPKSSLIGSNLGHFVPGLLDAASESLDTLTKRTLERRIGTASGRQIPVEISISRVAAEGAPLFTAIVRDVSERHAQQLALEHQATHDPLTGLSNRTALTRHLVAALSVATPQKHVALLMLDLSRFKEVNDTLGHDVGDEVLREVARRFSAQLSATTFISRIGGDEFTLVISNVEDRETLDTLCENLVDSLRPPIDARGIAIEVGVSIGIAIAPGDARDAKELLRHADIAMYVAKRHGSAYEYYAREDDQHTVRRLSMLSELRAAIENDGINLHYQPQVNLRSGRTESVEALLRWKHAIHGHVGPAEFVTLAEATDLIRPLTDWTIRRALADLASWNKRRLDLRVAINVSARVLQDVEFPRRFKALLQQAAIQPRQIELEITESAMLLDPERARRIVHDLHGLGVLISIDDYGTGFSSLGYLRDLRVHALKLDKSFVVDLETREPNRVIVESTVQMAHALGLQVVAEGVETEWVKNYLQSIDYDIGQGYWFAKPMSADDCCNWVLNYNAAAPQRLVG
jgi:diguanylate cyclase (GGDEF)-like protein/PAS domain S-box-containing protein